jgi:hypothetical protein
MILINMKICIGEPSSYLARTSEGQARLNGLQIANNKWVECPNRVSFSIISQLVFESVSFSSEIQILLYS